MKRTPISRKTPLQAGRSFAAMTAIRKGVTAAKEKGQGKAVAMKAKLRQSRSTGKPTKAQAARIQRLKEGLCVCCHLNQQGGLYAAYQAGAGCDAHHLIDGGRRLGHDFTVGLCAWHHRGIQPTDKVADDIATEMYGPSLARGSRPFHATYGSDAQLLALQNRILAGDVTP